MGGMASVPHRAVPFHPQRIGSIKYLNNRPFPDILTAGELALQFPIGQEIWRYKNKKRETIQKISRSAKAIATRARFRSALRSRRSGCVGPRLLAR